MEKPNENATPPTNRLRGGDILYAWSTERQIPRLSPEERQFFNTWLDIYEMADSVKQAFFGKHLDDFSEDAKRALEEAQSVMHRMLFHMGSEKDYWVKPRDRAQYDSMPGTSS